MTPDWECGQDVVLEACLDRNLVLDVHERTAEDMQKLRSRASEYAEALVQQHVRERIEKNGKADCVRLLPSPETALPSFESSPVKESLYCRS